MTDELRDLPALAAFGDALREAALREERSLVRGGQQHAQTLSVEEARRRARDSTARSRARRTVRHEHRRLVAAIAALVLVLAAALCGGIMLSGAGDAPAPAATSTTPPGDLGLGPYCTAIRCWP